MSGIIKDSLLLIIVFGIGIVIGHVGYLSETLGNNTDDVRTTTIPEPELIFKTPDVNCLGLEEINNGRVWICNNGHIEYDDTKVKFPSLDNVSEDTKEQEKPE